MEYTHRPKGMVVTWEAPGTNSTIRLTKKQEQMLTEAGVWPRAANGEEYCRVSMGLHYDHMTWTDDELRQWIADEKRSWEEYMDTRWRKRDES